ncbi:hypothetical protein FQA39_LY14509 [Lamprigera yunnana]|nr:hypothetical protein FQA39_LY14509 [Lamprigera yunnana]
MPAVICLAEHWLSELELANIAISNYVVSSTFSRKVKQGGGTVIFTRSMSVADAFEYGMSIGIFTLIFGEDQVVIKQYEKDLGFIREEYKKAGMDINFKETLYVTITEEEIKDLEIEKDLKFKGNGTTEEEIINRLQQTRLYIRQLHLIMWNTNITQNTK